MDRMRFDEHVLAERGALPLAEGLPDRGNDDDVLTLRHARQRVPH